MYHFILKWENGTDVPRRDRQCFIGFKLFFFSYKNKEKKGKGRQRVRTSSSVTGALGPTLPLCCAANSSNTYALNGLL